MNTVVGVLEPEGVDTATVAAVGDSLAISS